jgi:hypothetical protein
MLHWNGGGGWKRGGLSGSRSPVLGLPFSLGLGNCALVAVWVNGLGFGGEFRGEEAVLAHLIRHSGEIAPLLFQHTRFLLGRCGTGFHATLEATDTNADNVTGIVFVDDLGRTGDMVVAIAVGARKGGVLRGRRGIGGEDIGGRFGGVGD